MFAFPKSARVRHREDFGRALDQGVKTVCSQLVVFARPRRAAPGRVAASADSPSPEGTRLGLIVSRKVGEAVVRTRVKRRLREAFRHLRPDLDRTPELRGVDFVVVARANAAAASSAEITDALKQCLRRLSRQLASS